MHQASFLWQEAEHLETNVLQQEEFAVARFKAESLYNILQGAITQPDFSTSIGLPPPQKGSQVPTAVVLHLTTQEAQVPPPVAWPLGSDIPAEMTPLCIKIGNAHWVYHCWVKGCPEGPSSSSAAICSHVHCTHLDNKADMFLLPHHVL